MNPTIKEQRKGLGTWLEIDRSAIAHNYQVFKKFIKPETKFCAVLKSNTYGHDFMSMGKEVQKLGVDWIAVGNVTEGVRLRAEGVTLPILILYYTLPESFADAIASNLSVTISQFENLEYLAQLQKPIKIHIKIDTGMHRQGFMRADADRLFMLLKNNPHITVEGVYSHFASAGTASLEEKSQAQIAEFNWWKDQFTEQGFSPLFHFAASGATLVYPEVQYDMVRVGISLLGVWPSDEVALQVQEKNANLKPVLSWKTLVSEIKEVKKGESIGYDFTETLRRDSTIAICPVGYWHGYPRALSSIGEVLVNGKRAKVLGRVSMSMITIDITDIGAVKVQDEVVIIGTQGEQVITTIEIAHLISGSPYELMTRLNPLIKRIYF